jgi:hypothetical protein
MSLPLPMMVLKPLLETIFQDRSLRALAGESFLFARRVNRTGQRDS